MYDNPEFRRDQTSRSTFDLQHGKGREIIMQGVFPVYDDGSEGGGASSSRGRAANRLNLHGNAIMYDNPEFRAR